VVDPVALAISKAAAEAETIEDGDEEDAVEMTVPFLTYKLSLLPAPQYSY
jgi:hypothetical protein